MERARSDLRAPATRSGAGAAVTDLQAARAALAAQREAWSQQQAAVQNGRPTPTRAENQAAAAGDLRLIKSWDGSPVAADAIDALDPGVPPPAPPWIPTISGVPICGSTLTALPGLISSPQRAFQWTRDGQAIRFATGLRYVLVADDVGAMIGFAALTRSKPVAVGPRYILLGTARQVGPVRRRPASWA